MSVRNIKPVSNIGRYNKSINEKFYFEAIIIEYALLEGRLKSFLYYLGALKNRLSYKGVDNIKSKDEIKQIVSL